MHCDREMIANLAKLCRIACTEQEMAALTADFERIIDFFAQLEGISTENIATCRTVLEGCSTPLADDEVGEILDRRLFLDNAPSQVGGHIRTPPILTQDGKGVST